MAQAKRGARALSQKVVSSSHRRDDEEGRDKKRHEHRALPIDVVPAVHHDRWEFRNRKRGRSKAIHAEGRIETDQGVSEGGCNDAVHGRQRARTKAHHWEQ
eukprot:4127066-Pleurochrysis_carterae.AAC.2